MEFKQLALYLQRLEKTASRNQITGILSELFKKAEADEIDKIVYLSLGQLAPNYQGVVLNLAEKMMLRVLGQAYGVDLEKVKQDFKQRGDLGILAEELSKSEKCRFSVNQVFDQLIEIANDMGAKSQERKVDKMVELFAGLDSLSARFVARIPVGRLRLGFSDMTILDALSVMLTGDKSARKAIENAFSVSVDIGKIVKKIKEKGLGGVSNIIPIPGTPVRASLAERLPSAEKMLEKVGKTVVVEPKYDGFRSQVHIINNNGKKEIKIFSRNLENTTAMFPDLVEAAKKIKVKEAIFDGEAIAFDSKNDRFLPFQETIQRKRKHGIENAVKNIPLRLFIFDVLFKDGVNYLNVPFNQRRKVLEKIEVADKNIEITRQVVTDSPEVIRDLIKKYLSEGLEGAVIKKIDAPYKAGARGYHWVKYKKTTEEGVADTVDCLVMGINRGKGKRTGFGVGAFLVGIKDGEKFKTVSKIGTGLSDEQWKELDRRMQTLQSKQKPQEYIVNKNLEPDIWAKSSLVVEILADEITKSPIHTAGLALRFPRLIRFRDEKGPNETTTLKELEKFFEMQKI